MAAALKLSAGLFPVYPEFQKAPDETLKKNCTDGLRRNRALRKFLPPSPQN